MTQHHLPLRPLRQSLDHLMTPAPTLMVSREPTLWHVILIVLFHVILITREYPRAALFQIDLHYCQSRRVPIHAGIKSVKVRRVGIDTRCRCLRHGDFVLGGIIPWRVVQIDARCDFEEGAVERHPVEVES
jgi:hypothetical protein